MRIFNEAKTEIITSPDLTKGLLLHSTLTTHIPYSPAIEEVGHYETVHVYPNGGKDVKYVAEVEGREEVLEHDEEEEILIYREFTEKEKAEREIAELKSYLTSTDWTVIKCTELGLSLQTAYPEVYQKRTDARERINILEEIE